MNWFWLTDWLTDWLINYLNGGYSVAIEPEHLQLHKGSETLNLWYPVGIQVELHQIHTLFQPLNLLLGHYEIKCVTEILYRSMPRDCITKWMYFGYDFGYDLGLFSGPSPQGSLLSTLWYSHDPLNIVLQSKVHINKVKASDWSKYSPLIGQPLTNAVLWLVNFDWTKCSPLIGQSLYWWKFSPFPRPPPQFSIASKKGWGEGT